MPPTRLFCLLLLCACGQGSDSAGVVEERPDVVETASEDVFVTSVVGDSEGEGIVVRHILIPYEHSRGSSGDLPRRRQAMAQAENLLEQIRAGGNFRELARKHSVDASSRRGGFLGVGNRGDWTGPFEDAAFALQVGEISGLVETDFGFHIIKREPRQEVRLSHLFVQFEGCKRLTDNFRENPRGRAQAQALVDEALALLDEGVEFEEVAANFSDGPMGPRGADLGWFLYGNVGPIFEEVVFGLAPGEHSGALESPFGLHLVKRQE